MKITNRKNILNEFPEEFHDKLEDYIDEIEGKVNECEYLLKDISEVNDLHKVQECLSKLEDISRALY